MFQFLTQHRSFLSVVLYWIFSAAVSSMPEPGPNGSTGYRWLYSFCQTTAGNIGTVFANKLPGLLKSILPLLILPILLMTACGPRYTLHPGARNTADSVAYDTLLTAESVIDQARADNLTRPLPTDVKAAFNSLIQSYNAARDSYLTYRGAAAGTAPADTYLKQLNQNISDLAKAIRGLEQVRK